MVRSHCTILQLSGPVDAHRLERAYQTSKARYRRLTARGPLRYYRQDLLDDTEKAYRSLRRQLTERETRDHTQRGADSPGFFSRVLSVVARRAAEQGLDRPAKAPTASSVRKGCILPAQPKTLRARTVAHYAQETQADKAVGVDTAPDRRARAAREDDYCRQVIYRLEGDLIRYDSRRELLALASEAGIELFRANMLIAQIVEAVRQHKLYADKGSRGRSVRRLDAGQDSCPPPRRRRGLRTAIVVGTVITLALLVDAVLLHWLGKH